MILLSSRPLFKLGQLIQPLAEHHEPNARITHCVIVTVEAALCALKGKPKLAQRFHQPSATPAHRKGNTADIES